MVGNVNCPRSDTCAVVIILPETGKEPETFAEPATTSLAELTDNAIVFPAVMPSAMSTFTVIDLVELLLTVNKPAALVNVV